MDNTCRVPVCDRAAHVGDLCHGHYRRALRSGGDPGSTPIKDRLMSAVCGFAGCGRKHFSGSLCRAHHKQRLAGKPLTEVRQWTDRKIKRADGLRPCTRCGGVLPLSDFPLCANVSDGLSSYCRGCTAIANRATKYGLTPEKFKELLSAQNNSCALCQRGGIAGRDLCVDHDHECCPGNRSCGKCVRGLLCAPCNTGIGQLGDNPQRLRDAADYLDTHSGSV